MKVLYITANPKPEEYSFSLTAGREFINLYKQNNPTDEVIEIDVYKENIPYIDADVFNGWGKLQNGDALSESEQGKVNRINDLTDLFMEADKYVFVTPMWNFTVPPMMKAYIDTVCIAGKTFKYTENAPVGLLENKKALHIQSTGGIYSQGQAMDFELGNRYIKTVLGFLGVQDIATIFIEGTNLPEPGPEAIKAKASEEVQKVVKEF